MSTYLPILAQARGTSADIGAQASAFLDLIITPAGFAMVFLGLGVLTLALVSRAGTTLVASFAVFLLSMMRTDSKWSDNTLIPPLETLRTFSRPLAFALLIVLAMRSLAFVRGTRQVFLVLPAVLFLSYELYYVTMLGAFVDPFRGIFGAICYFAAITAFVLGLPRLMQDDENPAAFLKIFAIAGLMFIGANLLQLGGGYYNAVIQGRLTGISGNAQQFAMTCCIFVIVGCYFFASGANGSWTKWLAGVTLGLLGLFVLWSGSRTGAVCSIVIILAYFRTKLGRLALLGIVGGAAFAGAIAVFGESLEIVERFFRGGDTRSEVWSAALKDFANSPIFGQIPRAKDDTLNFTESTYLRTLALMGGIGGALLLGVLLTWFGFSIRVWRMGRSIPSLGSLSDFVIAGTAFFFVANIGEGLMLGVLTVFIPFIYGIFATGAFVLDAGAREIVWREEHGWDDEHDETSEDDWSPDTEQTTAHPVDAHWAPALPALSRTATGGDLNRDFHHDNHRGA
jgi:hypothetical protein